jgi:hypothetical protein
MVRFRFEHIFIKLVVFVVHQYNYLVVLVFMIVTLILEFYFSYYKILQHTSKQKA